MARRVITIDGLAGSGKTSLARELAHRLGWIYFSSGLLYRGVGFLALREGRSLDDDRGVAELLESHTLSLELDGKGSNVLSINGVPITEDLTQPHYSEAASRVGALPLVRRALVTPQREAFPEHNLVAEGRDMGTVIFPDAEHKFFVSAPEEVRIARRVRQFEQGGSVSTDVIEKEVRERDRRDVSREACPVGMAPDGILVDNGERPLTEVVQTLYDVVALRGVK